MIKNVPSCSGDVKLLSFWLKTVLNLSLPELKCGFLGCHREGQCQFIATPSPAIASSIPYWVHWWLFWTQKYLKIPMEQLLFCGFILCLSVS